MADLDDFLLQEIFVRLSVKSLHRFKCVSKHWLSLISDTRFVHEYVQFQTSRTNDDHDDDVYKNLHRTTFICRAMQGRTPCRLDLPSNAFDQYDGFSFKFIPKKIKRRGIKLLAASHGWILCCSAILSGMSRWINEYHLCSPLFKQWINIPQPPESKDKGYGLREFCSVGFMCEEDLISNCSSNSNTSNTVLAVKPIQFKVVQTWTNYHFLMMMVFSSESWKWRKEWRSTSMTFASSRDLCKTVYWEYWNPCTVSCDRTLYWIEWQRGMFALDLDADGKPLHWDHIPFPTQRVSDCLECTKLGLCQGQIHLSYWDVWDHVSSDTLISIWNVSKEVNTDDRHHYQWSLKHNVRIESSHFSFSDVRTVDFAPLDEDIVYIMLETNQTVVFNLKNNTMIQMTEFDYDHSKWNRVPFVLPYWPLSLKTPNSQPLKKKQVVLE